ncbi:hypothetical protein P8C59_003013 [Phyllachora maydis]|uniref:Clathrin/coatomer adaptor adaptin-like N-terminal domain-containing protein n=1 Tax=Phyllachora maydis TaxID=1825666 RepID=A0AAD9MC01_9PEZI|nr:hypothetical protein P8C59_003013 [Phyllachora maydis]
MESIARISTLLENARELTLDAASAARSARGAARPLDRAQVKKLVDSGNEREVLDGLRRVVSMMYRGQNTLPLFSSVVKKVASAKVAIKKLVYIYLVHHAEQEPDLALLSINTMQKSLSDANAQVRALALRTMSAIRVPVISQIVSLAIKKGAGDMSPHVRKAAALAIPKCYSLDPSQLPQLLDYLSTLLGDRQYFVAGAAVTAFMELCPDRIDLIHAHYRSLLSKILDMDEWGQMATLRLMTVYARSCFPRRTEAELELLLNGVRPLLHSRNAGVVVGVARCYAAVGTPAHVQTAVGPVVALLRSAQEVQQMALVNMVAICLDSPADFVRYASHFLVRAADRQPVWELKLELLTLVFPHAPAATKSLVLTELEHFSRGADKALVREAVRAIGRCAQADAAAAPRCLRLLLGQITSRDGTLAAESLTVLRLLIQRDPAAHTGTVVRLARNLDSATDPLARATIIWLVGEFAGTGGEDNMAPDVLRILLKGFAAEAELVRRQVVLLAAKVYLHHVNRRPDETAEGGGEDDGHPIARLWAFVLLLARYDTSYDLRDRARVYKALLAVPQLATLVLLAPKPAPQAPSPSEARRGYALGSASLALGGGGGRGLRGYQPLPDWVREGEEPDARLRLGGSNSSNSSSSSRSRSRPGSAYGRAGSLPGAGTGAAARTNANGGGGGGVGVKTLDDWLAEDEGGEEESEEEEETEDEEDEETEEEEDDDGEDALDGRPADHQLLMLRYGTLLAWTSKAGLSAAVVMAFRQRVWTTVRTAVALAVFVPLSPLIVILTANHGLAWEEAEEKERSGVKKVRIGYGPVTRPAWGWGHAPRPGFGPEGEGDADQARGRHLEGKAACRPAQPSPARRVP